MSKLNNTAYKSCQIGKWIWVHFKTKENASTGMLQLVYTYLCGLVRIETPSGELYFMSIIDDYTKHILVAFLKKKFEAFEKFKILKDMDERQID